ncbi:sulfite oxidase [Alteribacillus sp. JSM 102045]|uniref:sulfite oxidase n=1 Tax=Alteribacillus sp. JSM 102045 TaxID=1562101 RepID=UPI0035BF82B7
MLIYYHHKNRPYLITRSLDPDNQESPIHFLRSRIISSEYTYRRNHFAYPLITPENFIFSISGQVSTPLTFHYYDLLKMPSKTIKMVLECAGNKRAMFEPRTFGEQWKDGAVTQGVWKGVPLTALLSMTGIKADAQEVVFEGFDAGKRKDMEETVPFARSLPLQSAFHPDILVAYEYNNQPLSYKHGFPFRLIVPRWYAMASVKWLKKITVINRPFYGPFQTIDYVYYSKDNSEKKRPVTYMNVNSIIQQPLDYSVQDERYHLIYGIAWSGKGRISKGEISFDQGKKWDPVILDRSQEGPYSWTPWHYLWKEARKGEYIILLRASDSTGRVQPEKPDWNKKGYGYNAISKVHIKIE